MTGRRPEDALAARAGTVPAASPAPRLPQVSAIRPVAARNRAAGPALPAQP